MKIKLPKGPLAIAVAYFVFGFLWILLSDTFLARISPDYDFFVRLQTIKGWIYVALTTGLIYALVSVYSIHKNRLLKDLSQREADATKNVQEKELLLREVHHRVKNNLQLIQSVINLNRRHYSEDPAALFDHIGDRIHAIAMVHEKIYVSCDLSAINAKEYLADLAGYLFVGSAARQVTLEMSVETIHLVPDVAVPCGIILHEVLTNALKYAFPDGNLGRVSVSLKEHHGEKQFLIADNGVGFDVALYKHSFGLQLISILSHQLSGAGGLTSDSNGTRFSLKFT